MNLEDFSFKHLKIKVIFGLSFLSIVLISSILILYFLFLPPKVKGAFPSTNSSDVGLTNKITITFNRPVNRNTLNTSISPDIKGVWSFEGKILSSHLYNKVSFTPEDFFEPNTKYEVEISDISSILGKTNPHSYTYEFTTQTIPNITKASIENNFDKQPICEPITFYLDQENNGLVDYNFYTDPETELESEISDDYKSYKVKAKNCFDQGVKYKMAVDRIIKVRQNNQELNAAPKKTFELNFKTKNSPEIDSFYPSGSGVLTTIKQISINFSEEMVQEDVLKNISIFPAIEGSWKWQDNKKIVFNLKEKLNYNQQFKITIIKGVRDKSKGFTKKDITLRFATIGYVKVNQFYPADGSTNISVNSPVYIYFNQQVDHNSAQDKFSIEPNVEGNFTWEGNKLIFIPKSSFNRDAEYTVQITSDIKSIYGLDSTQSFRNHFFTESSKKTLNINADLQDKPLSCEAASLKMALAYRGVAVSENDIMGIVGYDPTPHSGNTWGDPYNAFVGDIYGRQNTTGYGVYWDPIAKAANHYRSAKAFSGWSAVNLAKEIQNNNPVIIWGVYGNGYYDPWFTPSGKKIDAWKGEHARTLIGFEGTVDNPTAFILNDPYAGRITWSRATLENDWKKFNNSGVVVY